MGETTGSCAPGKTNIEQLRIILAERSGTDVTYEEAEEVGIELVSLYECLSREHASKKEGGDGRTD